MFKKKEKIKKKEVYDSILLAFKLEADDSTITEFKLNSEDNNCHVEFSICDLDKPVLDRKKNERSIIDEIFDEKTHESKLPFLKQSITSEGEVMHYVLILKEFLNYSHAIEIHLVDDKKEKPYIEYFITSVYDKYMTHITFQENDMYPSVVKYIIDTATEAMYKKTL